MQKSESNKNLNFGMLRCGAAAPRVSIGDVDANVAEILRFLKRAEEEQVDLICFPELSMSGYTCGDLFHQTQLLDKCIEGLSQIAEKSEKIFKGCLVVGAPISHQGKLFNCGIVISGGEILGVVPKCHLPNYKEFYERRWFASGLRTEGEVTLQDRPVPFGSGLLFVSKQNPLFRFSVEVCEDLWMPISESSVSALNGALVTVNLSASNEVAGKAEYRRTLVRSQSGRNLGAYVYAGAGPFESTTDLVFGGHCMIAENGVLIEESAPFLALEPFIFCDVDLEKLHYERMRTGTFGDGGADENGHAPSVNRKVLFENRRPARSNSLLLHPRPSANPYLPENVHDQSQRCEEIFRSQVIGLQMRLTHLHKSSPSAVCTIGVSGGLDSTLALLVAACAFDALKLPRNKLQAFTMPGFGTSQRTLSNAKKLMHALGISHQEIDIRNLAFEEMRSISHAPFGIDISACTLDELLAQIKVLPAAKRKDLTFENVQARIRTSVLMNKGFVIGTGDLSEIALGWSTYNADHMSMYNPNSGVPKTLVKHLVRWACDQGFAAQTGEVLKDILATEVSPELLPLSEKGEIIQLTEETVGPYELHDFFLFYFVRYGFSPEKILHFAEQAKFARTYDRKTLVKWLKLFLERFFANQYKRSASPDGPKVGSVSLSPRGDWRMPSDAVSKAWLDGLN